MFRVPLSRHLKRGCREFRKRKSQFFELLHQIAFRWPVPANDVGIIMIHDRVYRWLYLRQLVYPRRDNAARFQHSSRFGFKPLQIEPMQRLRHGDEIGRMRLDPTVLRRPHPVFDTCVPLRVPNLPFAGIRPNDSLEHFG